MYTFQDFEESNDVLAFIAKVISYHEASPMVQIARDADNYARQMNTTICHFVPTYYDILGRKKVDLTKSNHHIACNFFDYLNSQRCNYSLGEGLIFKDENAIEKLGKEFSETVSKAGYYALIHGESFMMWTGEKMYVFKLTEFVPLVDEETSALRAGIRYWQLAPDKPMMAVLYEEDGYTVYKSEEGRGDFREKEPKRAYRIIRSQAPADSEPEILGEDNWGMLPIFPLWGSKLHQSTLVGMKGSIDAYDLGKSGFANSMDNLNELLTVVSNANGMDEMDVLKLRDWMKTQGIITADEGQITTINQTVDHAARTAFLNELRQGIFEDFGGLDVHTIMSGATNDHIAAAYEPLNAKADDFEDQITHALEPFLQMIGIDDAPGFKRRAIANDSQYNSSVLAASQYLDDRTILEKLTFIDNDEIDDILDRKAESDVGRFTAPEEGDVVEDREDDTQEDATEDGDDED